jgi:hypothetical protein
MFSQRCEKLDICTTKKEFIIGTKRKNKNSQRNINPYRTFPA